MEIENGWVFYSADFSMQAAGMKMYIQLKPCPFCGGEVATTDFQFGNQDREGWPVNIQCPDCGCCGPWNYTASPAPDMETLNLWDKRVDPTP